MGASSPTRCCCRSTIEDAALKAEWLAEKRAPRRAAQGRSRCWCPQRGDRRKLVELAQKNARRQLRHAAQRARRHRGGARQAAAAAEAAAAAAAHRVLRHLAHPGLRDGGVDGRVRRRAAGEGALPHVQGRSGDRQRRLRVDVRGAVAAVPAREAGRRRASDDVALEAARPDRDRRRQGPARDGAGGGARRRHRRASRRRACRSSASRRSAK